MDEKQLLIALIRALFDEGVIKKETFVKNMNQEATPFCADLEPAPYDKLDYTEIIFLESIPTYFRHGLLSVFRKVDTGKPEIERDINAVSQHWILWANRRQDCYVSLVARRYRKTGQTYLGGIWHGPAHSHEMRDLADGAATFQTWEQIVLDMKEMDGG